MIFCDWLNIVVNDYDGPEINNGFFLSLDREGNQEYAVDRRLSVRGSWDGNTMVRAWTGRLEISGNPTKFLQGHNLFGSGDVCQLAFLWVSAIFDQLNIYDPNMLNRIKSGDCWVNRIDLTGMYSVGLKNSDVQQWIVAAGPILSRSRQMISLDDGSITIGRHSKRLKTIIYNKGKEIIDNQKKQPLTFGGALNGMLSDWSENKLRVEHKLLRGWLVEHYVTKNGIIKSLTDGQKNYYVSGRCHVGSLRYLRNWSQAMVDNVYKKMYAIKIQLPPESVYKNFDLIDIPPVARGTFALWNSGADITAYMKRATLYRHRKLIKDSLSIDIFVPKSAFVENKKRTTVIPLMKPLEASVSQVPDFAYKYHLIAC